MSNLVGKDLTLVVHALCSEQFSSLHGVGFVNRYFSDLETGESGNGYISKGLSLPHQHEQKN